ncbi:MAG: Ig-like domain-containing protein [Proteobacteria bacterium]|nr:Ig-like domain-containing protein [Pseudomonadota bacterium]
MFVGLTLAASTALAEPIQQSGGRPAGALGTTRLVVPTPVERFTPHADPQISTTLYMNRCVGDCTVHLGTNDARTMMSSIAGDTTAMHTIREFTNSFGDKGVNGHCTVSMTACTTDAQCGAGNGTCNTADKDWADTVQCMKEVYSPFNVKIVDALPTDGSNYHMGILAGTPQDLGLGGGILGIAPLAGDCSPQDNVISFSFANAHSANDRVNNLCWTIAQESAHAFGLDHEFSYVSSPVGGVPRSACNDPMTYRTDCGGEKFFRNDTAKCGEDVERDCRCGGTQNSHLKILNVFGAGTPITGKPTTSILFPLTGATIANGVNVTGKAFAKRGIARVELWINGYNWGEVPGGPFGSSGQPESTYQIPIPTKVPDSVVDLVFKAYDDLGAETDSATQTVTKNKACTDDASCKLDGMTCSSDGKCAWPPAVGAIGEDCTFNEFCLSGLCVMTADGGVCSKACHPGIMGECDTGFECMQTAPGAGVCLIAATDGGGCCSVGDGPGVWVHGGVSFLVLGYMFRRRGKRA